MMRLVLLAAVCLLTTLTGGEPPKKSPKEALQVFHDLIGSWKGTGRPEQGTREDRDRGFWQEVISWQWQFKDKVTPPFLVADLEKGKHYTRFELRYLADKDGFELKATTPSKETHTFAGAFADKKLTVTRTDEKAKQTQRLVFSLLHNNRHLYYFEVKPSGSASFTRAYQVGATKQGVAFASEDKGPECVVSGGLGTIPVAHKGKTYFVCCTGCRDAFKEDPEKYIKEFEEAKKSKK